MRAIVGADDEFIAGVPHAILPEEKRFCAGSDDRNGLVPRIVQGSGDRINGGYSHSSTHTEHRAIVINLGGVAQRTGEAGQCVTHLQRAKMVRGLTYFLKDKGDSTSFSVEIGEGERDPLSFFHDPEDCELPGTALLGDLRSTYLDQLGYRRQFFLGNNLIHIYLLIIIW